MAEKESQFEKIKRISSTQKNIRNIATSAHIHHGKTALTDNLLAASGHMAAKSAGNLDAGMATWQHSDEQERLMTVDAANVSMVHDFHGNEYLINLIDTPGHVDFGGNVTRAMRAIDGTIVLVCAVEGIMPQTETVIKQALKERVKPVLFINKVDRLIKELKLTSEQMQKRFIDIFHEFNDLVKKIADQDFKEKWAVDIKDGSVAFGSARENWALSVPFMQKKGITFKDIFRLYQEMDEKEKNEWVWKNAPLYEVLLDMVVKHLPDPLEAQKYRIPKIWHGEVDSELGKGLINCDPKGKIAFVITRIVIEPKSGKEISAGRLFSGTLKTVAKEDPSIKIEINEQTGESLMSGMGELHLEIIENRIKTEKGLDVKTSEPIIVYRETIGKESPVVEGRSPNKHNSFYIKVEPLEDEIYNAIKSGELHEGRVKKKSDELASVLSKLGWAGDSIRNVRDVYKGNIFMDDTRGEVHIGEVIEMVLDAFEMVVDQGPLAREPCIKMKVSLDDTRLHEDAIHRGPAQVYPAVREAIHEAMRKANPALLEPMQIHVIEMPDKFLSAVTKLVGGKRGQMLEVKQDASGTEMKTKLPVAEMIGWSSDLRSATEGRGTSALADQMFEKTPASIQAEVIRKIRTRKGLAENQ